MPVENRTAPAGARFDAPLRPRVQPAAVAPAVTSTVVIGSPSSTAPLPPAAPHLDRRAIYAAMNARTGPNVGQATPQPAATQGRPGPDPVAIYERFNRMGSK